MRIAIVIDSFIRGGAERQALYAARELARRGCEVEVIYYYDIPDSYNLTLGGKAKFTYLPKRGTYVRFFFWLWRYLLRNRFDVVHAYKSIACIYGCTAAALAGVPVVFGGYREQYTLRGVARLGHRLMNRFITGWIVNSRGIAETLVTGIGADQKKISVVYNGIEDGAFASDLSPEQARERLGLSQGAQVVSIIGRLRPEKNHEMFLRMASCVRHDLPKVVFLVVGDGPMESGLRRLAASLEIEDVVHFLGLRDDIGDLLAATDVCVVTSPREGLANSLVEAMSVGVPVISTDYAGVDEVLSNDVEGFVVPRDDAEAMAAQVVLLLANEPLRKRMGAAGIKRVAKQFGLDVMGGRLLQVYSDHLQEAHHKSRGRSR